MLQSAVPISAAVVLCTLLALQYPLQTTFPIGGDAASHISNTQYLWSVFDKSATAGLRALGAGPYPAASAFMALVDLLPLGWPDKFVWLSVAAHVTVGVMLGLAVGRVGGWRAAAAAIAMWGLTTTLTRHFINGTLPQLMSLASIGLFFERLSAQRFLHAYLTIPLTFLLHPLSGTILAVSAILALPAIYVNRAMWPRWHMTQFTTIIGITAALLLGAFWWLAAHRFLFTRFAVEPTFPNFSFLKLLSGYFGFTVILAPVGIMWLIIQSRRQLLYASILSVFLLISTLLAFNHLLGVGIWTPRFASYFIVAATLAGSLGLPIALRSIPFPRARPLLAAALLAIAATLAWRSSASVYASFEDPATYQRLHPDELTALTWAAHNLSDGSVIASTEMSQHATWIPILAHRPWVRINAPNADAFRQKGGYSHMMFFTLREGIPPEFLDERRFPTIFSNHAIVIKTTP